jgi:phage terminase large subunit
MFEVTTSVRKMLALDGKNKIIQGATSSGKTYGIIPILYDRALATPNTLITIVAETIPSLKDGCVKIFQDFMFEQNRWREDCWLGNPMQYTLPNRSRLQFKSFDSEGKAKASGKREILFINEANHVPFSVADALMIRTTKEVWIDFNADSEFWGHTELLKEPKTDFLKLTYLDNEQIPQGTLEKMLTRKDKAEQEERNGTKGYWWNWWQVYGLGEIGSLQGVVFNNWSEIDTVPKDAKFVGYGVDFGYTNDPTTVIMGYEYNGVRIYDEVVYRTGLLNNDIADLLKANDITKRMIGYADSADPKSIDDINRYGYTLKPVTKGADSIMYGVGLMQEKPFQITKRSTNLRKELRNYCWANDKDGADINKPIDAWNHGIDSCRYLEMELKLNKRGKMRVRTFG